MGKLCSRETPDNRLQTVNPILFLLDELYLYAEKNQQ